MSERVSAESVQRALEVFALTPPLTRAVLEDARRELQARWHPPRYANLTNNPRRYMQMYRKAEAMVKQIDEAYGVLSAWLDSQDDSGGGTDRLVPEHE